MTNDLEGCILNGSLLFRRFLPEIDSIKLHYFHGNFFDIDRFLKKNFVKIANRTNNNS